MTTDTIPGALVVIGSVVFGIGAAVGVPRVFTEWDPDGRIRMRTVVAPTLMLSLASSPRDPHTSPPASR